MAPQRELPAKIEVDVAILGAGIHGASLARELTLRNVSCALIDCGAVGGGTSQWSSKLLHGGIRYLQTRDVAQMREGLKERATWVRIAPHRCCWEAFWMPHRHFFEGLTHFIGIGLYDWWGNDRPAWPGALSLGPVPKRTFSSDPRSVDGPFAGATAYADLLTWDRELTQDLAASSDAMILDFHQVCSFSKSADNLADVQLKDRRNGEKRSLSAKQWVFALGPWTDEAMHSWFGETKRRLRLSAGIHFWMEAPSGVQRPWTIPRPDGRVIFVIPRDGRLLVGTTEREVHSGWVPIVDAEREYLLSNLKAVMPSIPWNTLPILAEELGVRPLVTSANTHTARLSREAVLEHHPQFPNLTLVLGGKLTTARALMDKLATHLTGLECPESTTKPLAISNPN